jgi:hypothetical protein
MGGINSIIHDHQFVLFANPIFHLAHNSVGFDLSRELSSAVGSDPLHQSYLKIAGKT